MLLKNVDEAEVPEMEIDVLIQTDPVAKQLSAELGWKKIDESYNEGARKKGGPNAYADQYHDQVERLQKQFDERRALLEKKARQKKSSLISRRLSGWKQCCSLLTDGQKAAKTKIDEREELAKSLSQTSVDIQMIQAQLRNLDQVMANFVNEKEKLGAEIKSTPRIRVQEMAEEPPIPSNTLARYALTALAVIASFCFPVLGIALWDTRTHRINTTADVSHGLRLPVIGSMPLVPSRVIRQLGSPLPRHRGWHLRLTESIEASPPASCKRPKSSNPA